MPLYSHSRLGTYENCPFQYKLRYVDKVKPLLGNTIESFMGSRVHDSLEWLYQIIMDTSQVMSKDLLINKYDKLWSDKWNDDIRVVKKEFTDEYYKDIGRECLKNYYERYNPFDQAETISLEERIIFDLPDGKKMQGYIDRLDRISNNHYVVHDYKTSSRLPSQSQADKDRQLGLYALAVKQQYPNVQEVGLVWHYVKFDKEVSSSRNQSQLNEMASSTVSLIKDIESATERRIFPTKTSILCNWCEFKAQCPEYSHQYSSQIQISFLETTTISSSKAAETVDKLVELNGKKRELLADMEAMIDTLENKLFNYSKESGNKAVFGKEYKAIIKLVNEKKIAVLEKIE